MGNAIIAIMTIANFGLLILLTNHVLKANRAMTPSTGEEEALIPTTTHMPESDRAMTVAILPAVSQSDIIEQPIPRATQTQTALLRLKAGESPDRVAHELGYSRSEIGILAASARKSLVEV